MQKNAPQCGIEDLILSKKYQLADALREIGGGESTLSIEVSWYYAPSGSKQLDKKPGSVILATYKDAAARMIQC